MPSEYSKLVGVGGRLFADPEPSPDEVAFQVDNTSAQYYTSPYYLQHKDDLQPVPAPRMVQPRLNLGEVVGPEILDPIAAAKKISFHAVGDTGAAKVNSFQTAREAIENEAIVADAMARDVRAEGAASGPAFFFHLGDVVYNFGEAQYYYDQFYEPYRSFDRPIFAIPGNHDGAVFGQNTEAPQVPTLAAFLRNFCADAPQPSPDAGGLVRSTMTQPGVYFTLDAPFVSIVGLYTNVLEGPGVISSQGGVYPSMTDDQLHFLDAELQRLAPARKAGERAVIIACHHPPVSVDAKHGGATGLADDIDAASRAAGFWPDAVLSGHAHLYQRFTRRVDGREIPYVVAGSGGFAATPPRAGLPAAPLTIGEYTLVQQPIIEFGYLTVTIDMSKKTSYLTIKFQSRSNLRVRDTLTLNLKTGKIRKSHA